MKTIPHPVGCTGRGDVRSLAQVAVPVAASHGHRITVDARTAHSFPEGGTGTKELEAGGDGERGYGVGIDTGNRSLPQRDRCHISYL